MNIRELASQTGSAERQIRYMIAEGFVAPPRGTRSQPDYGDDHVEAVRRYLALRQLGLPPAAIRIVSETGDAVLLPIADGIALSVDPRLLGRPLDIEAITERLVTILNRVQKERPP